MTLRELNYQKKLPWCSVPSVLVVLLIWRVWNSALDSVVVPGLAMLCAAAMLMTLAVRVNDKREFRLLRGPVTLSSVLGLVF